MNRREIAFGLMATTMWPDSVWGQNPALKVGFLNRGNNLHLAGFRDAFLAGLRDEGFEDGLNVQIMYRWANGSSEALNSFARDLVRENVNVIVATGGGRTPFVAKDTTSKIPIVFVTGSDPIAVGLVKTLNRPEANLTGITFFGVNLIAKRFEILKEISPSVQKIALLVGINPNETNVAIESAQAISKALAVRTKTFHIRSPQDIDPTMQTIKRENFDGIIYGSDPVFGAFSERIARTAVTNGIAAVGQRQVDVEAGGLAIYGTSIPDAYKEAGRYAARILKGAKPNDLPVIRPSAFIFSINMSAAKRLKLTIPPSVLVSATSIIE